MRRRGGHWGGWGGSSQHEGDRLRQRELRDEEQPGDHREAHDHRHGDDRHDGRIEHAACIGDERAHRGDVAAIGHQQLEA